MTQEMYKDLFVLDDNKCDVDDLLSILPLDNEPYVEDKEALARSNSKNQEMLAYSTRRLEEIMSKD